MCGWKLKKADTNCLLTQTKLSYTPLFVIQLWDLFSICILKHKFWGATCNLKIIIFYNISILTIRYAPKIVSLLEMCILIYYLWVYTHKIKILWECICKCSFKINELLTVCQSIYPRKIGFAYALSMLVFVLLRIERYEYLNITGCAGIYKYKFYQNV